MDDAKMICKYLFAKLVSLIIKSCSKEQHSRSYKNNKNMSHTFFNIMNNKTNCKKKSVKRNLNHRKITEGLILHNSRNLSISKFENIHTNDVDTHFVSNQYYTSQPQNSI